MITYQWRFKNKIYGYERPWFARTSHCLSGKLFLGNKDGILSNIFNILLLFYVASLIIYFYMLLWDNGYKIALIASIILFSTFAINLFQAAYTDPGVLLRPKDYQSLKEADDLK